MLKNEAKQWQETPEEPEKRIDMNRVWGYQELALQYFPHIKPESASVQFRRWIKLSDTLTGQLVVSGWKPGRKVLSPKQVSLIVGHLGHP